MDNTFKKKEQLFSAAVKEFGENGFQNASLNKILTASKVSKGVFYHHYESKEALYLDITGDLLEKKKTFISRRLSIDDLNGDVFHILKKGMSLSFEFGELNPIYVKFSTMLMKDRGNPIFSKVMSKYNVTNDAYVSGLIHQGIQNGNIRLDLSPEFIFRIISHMLNHINELLDTKDLQDYRMKIDELFSFLESGLRIET